MASVIPLEIWNEVCEYAQRADLLQLRLVNTATALAIFKCLQNMCPFIVRPLCLPPCAMGFAYRYGLPKLRLNLAGTLACRDSAGGVEKIMWAACGMPVQRQWGGGADGLHTVCQLCQLLTDMKAIQGSCTHSWQANQWKGGRLWAVGDSIRGMVICKCTPRHSNHCLLGCCADSLSLGPVYEGIKVFEECHDILQHNPSLSTSDHPPRHSFFFIHLSMHSIQLQAGGGGVKGEYLRKCALRAFTSMPVYPRNGQTQLSFSHYSALATCSLHSYCVAPSYPHTRGPFPART